MMLRTRLTRLATVTLAIVLLDACGGGDGGDLTGGGAPPIPPAPVRTNTIRLFTSGGARFEPATVEVPVGTTVTFVWQDGVHDVSSTGNPSFESSGDPVAAPKSFPVTFTTAGTYTFFCSVHGTPTGGMRGTVTVR